MAAGRPVTRCALTLGVLTALALSSGCSEVGAEIAFDILGGFFDGMFEDLEVSGARVSAGATTYWSVPSEIEKPGTYGGIELDWYFANQQPPPQESIFGFGMSYYGDGDGGGLFMGRFFWDIGRAISRAGGRDPWWWVVARPELGFWVWSEAAPDLNGGRSGPLTGVSLGLAKWFPRGLNSDSPHMDVLSAVYCLERINNVVGNDDATVGKVIVSYTWRW